MTDTFSMWFGDFIADFYAGKFEGQRLGQAFINQLHYAGKHTQANALIFSKDDPFHADEVSIETLSFLDRVWDWPQG